MERQEPEARTTSRATEANPNAAGDGAATPPDPVVARFWETLRRLPRYLTLGVNLARDDRLPTSARAAVIAGGVYAVSPIDLVPGIIPVAGQLDDMVVILLALRRAIRACPPALAEEHLTRAGVRRGDFDDDLATCRAAAVWLARKGLRFGGRVAAGAGRRLWSAMGSKGQPSP